MPVLTRAEAARERSRQVVQRSHRPSQRRSVEDAATAWRSPYRASAAATPALQARMQVERGTTGGEPDPNDVTVRGFATVYESAYEMWDMWGRYTEIVSAGAGAITLAANPDVKFLFNHRDMPMARTREAETLELSEEDHGLLSVARPEMRLPVSQSVVTAIEAKLLDEMSFAFVIVRGEWSPDWETYRIHEYDIHRGDTSAVTYGANPHTEINVERAASGPAEGTVRTLSPEELQKARRLIAAPLL